MSYTFTAFDDWIEKPSGSGAVVHSSCKYDEILGLLDQVAFEVSAEQGVGGNPILEVRLQHSADGINWNAKNNVGAEIEAYPLNPTDPTLNVRVGVDDGSVPSLRFVRFKMTVTGTGQTRCHVRIVATINDARENAFARRIGHVIYKLEQNNPCKEIIPGGTHIAEEDWADQLLKEGYQTGFPTIDPSGVVSASKRGLIHVKCGDRNFDEGVVANDLIDCRYIVPDDGSVCVKEDGSVVVSRYGHQSRLVKTDSGAGEC